MTTRLADLIENLIDAKLSDSEDKSLGFSYAHLIENEKDKICKEIESLVDTKIKQAIASTVKLKIHTTVKKALTKKSKTRS